MQCVFGIIPCTQQLVKRTSINGGFIIHCFSLIVLSHTKFEYSLTHSIELMYDTLVAIQYYATVYLATFYYKAIIELASSLHVIIVCN